MTGITLGIALLGAVLGIINTWHQINKNRVKLRVVPKIVQLLQGQDISKKTLCIEVVNLSTFSLTISNVGFMKQRGEGSLILLRPILPDGKPWPRRLEPRGTVTAFFSEEGTWNRELASVRKAVAVTDCGVTRYGSIKKIKSHIHKLNNGEPV